MSPEKRRVNQAQLERLNKPTAVVLGERYFIPISFTIDETVIGITNVQSVQTEVRKSWSGTVEKNIYMVRTEIGTFQLQHDLIKNSWTLVGKLREEKPKP